ncbi:unnamed protein product [Prorocentrum cordatum]|uniref:Uncharacterized protein n=1 Tax=Prorocentrum cordatum TaxID=2364126 RepID=A0ABN9QUM6_9DINO|nr:unnamed protein product [Polarella glacialis]
MLDVVIERLHPSESSRPAVKAAVSQPSIASNSADDKSSLSQPLDKVADWKAVWEELISVSKHPVAKMVPELRSYDLEEVSASEFYVTLNTAAPALQYIVHCKYDKAHGVFSAESSGNDNSEPEKTWALFYKEPLVIECWGEQKIARGFGAARCEQIKAFLDTVIKRVRPDLGRSGVQVTSNEKLRCAISSPLDAILSFDRLWNELVELLKRPQTQGVLKEATLKVASDTEFTVVHTLDGASLPRPEAKGKGKGKGVDDVKTILKYRIDKSKGEVYRDCYRMAGGLIDRGWIMVRTRPLRLESWTETPGLRLTGHDKARQVQDILDGVVGLTGA